MFVFVSAISIKGSKAISVMAAEMEDQGEGDLYEEESDIEEDEET